MIRPNRADLIPKITLGPPTTQLVAATHGLDQYYLHTGANSYMLLPVGDDLKDAILGLGSIIEKVARDTMLPGSDSAQPYFILKA